jgi:predicted alpha/beta hydrolase family esterase
VVTHVTFIHGIANKPPAEELHQHWLEALARDGGIDLAARGVSSRLVYWADLLYEKPLPGTAGGDGLEAAAAAEVAELATGDADWLAGAGAEQRRFVGRLAAAYGIEEFAPDDAPPASAEAVLGLERIPLPVPVKRWLMAQLLRDVHHYLYDVTHEPRAGERYAIQQEIRRRVVEALRDGAERPGPHLVLAHSMGTVIIYDCLKRVPDAPAVDGLVTIGGPLGLDEIQDAFAPEWSRQDGFPRERLRGRWVNVFDRLDPVPGFDPEITNDYRHAGREVVDDVHQAGWGRWRHSLGTYLAGQRLRDAVLALLAG